MDRAAIRSAVISTDGGFREAVQHALVDAAAGVTLGLEVTVPFRRFGEEQLQQLRQVDPDLIFIDLEDEPALGIKLAHFLADTKPLQRFIAVGPTLAPELLMDAMRAGVSEYLPKPVTAELLGAAVERVAQKLGWSTELRPRTPSQVFAFFSAKGGSGCTTVATNLAIVIHRLTGKRTLLVDLDVELGEISLLLGVQPRFNFVDMIQNFHRMDAGLLASYIERHDSGVHLLSAPYHPEKAAVVTSEQIRKILQFLRGYYDYILVDTSKSFSPVTLAIFEQADLVCLVTNADLPSLRNIQRGLPTLKQRLGKGDQQIRLIVNRYRDKSVISLKDVERSVGLKVYCTLSNDYQAVIQSINTGKPIVLNGKSPYTRDLKALGAKLAGWTGPTRGVRRLMMNRVSGIFRRWKEVKGND